MRRYTPEDDLAAVHNLLTRAFAYMEGRIDPASSLSRLDTEGMKALAAHREVWVMEEGNGPVGCMVLTPKDDTLYLGKLAVDYAQRGKGLARILVDQALRRAGDLGLDSVTLETRIELTENHAAFTALGFHKADETAHPGYDRPTSITMVRPLGTAGRAGGRRAKRAARNREI
ncbi:Acetyltransferase (GNAT) family protein [Roseovarius litorisediminis]|uniref:Acetyltransferase (GNAT) family protein n=2 Tax=Roseovarius litorisediminis TaxID=1312363 RepID=A0A1Y5TGH1_9RHOB|nr:Acetyltransferase (GNAT) family protein [Roseovarius litorisediminis]